MNLHNVVSSMIGTVNPSRPAQLLASTGASTTAPDGTRMPSYADPQDVIVQAQDLSSKDVRQNEALNLQTVQQAMYLSGTANGVVRVSQKGGDLIVFDDGTTWLVVVVYEQWEWVKVGVCLQNTPALS